MWFSIFFLVLVPLWFFVFSGVSVVVVFAPHPSLPFPLLFGGLFVVAEAEFGFVPALLREFSPFIEEGWIVYLAHYVHLLSKAKSTTSTPLGVWVGMF